MPRVNAAQQLPFVKTERDGMVALPGARFPCGFLAGQHEREAIEIRNKRAIEGLVKDEEARLVAQQLADRHPVLPLLRELRPIRADAFVVIQPVA